MRSAGFKIFGSMPDALDHYGWALAITLPLIWRRSHPEIVVVAIATIFIAGQALATQETQIASVAMFTALYSVGAWGRDRERVRWVRILVIASMFVWLSVSITLSWDQIADAMPADAAGPLPAITAAIINSFLTNMLLFGFFAYFGEMSWLAARRQYQLESQTAELRTAQELAGERAVIGERVRIARELHDVVAHHVSVMGIQAAAARRSLDKDAGKARTALAAVEDSARTAVDELRRMLGALRQSDQGRPDQGRPDQGRPDRSRPDQDRSGRDAAPSTAGLDRLDELITRVREAGLTGELAVYGDPKPVPDSVSQAAYRIVQEAVTNSLKHARASTVDVRVRYLARELEIDVTDDGRGPVTATGGGMGLIGMRERVAVHDGTIEAGARSGGGYRVRVRLPLHREMAGQP